MDIFNYLMNKKGHNLFYNDKILSYLLGKNFEHEEIGTSIDIPNGKNAIIKEIVMTKASTQDGTPNPTNPIEVNTVKGYRNLAYTGWASDFVTRINDDTKAILETFDNKNCLWYKANAGYQEYDTKYMFKINWKENTRYTIRFNIYMSVNYKTNLTIQYTDGTSEEISSNQQANAWRSVIKTSASNKTINYIRVLYSSGNCYIDLDTFMVVEGTQALPYVPYGTNWIYTTITDGTNTKNIPIPLNDNEICGIGDYKDELIVDKNGHCWLNKKIGKVVFDGSSDEDWQKNQTYPNVFYYDSALIGRTGTDMFSNYFTNGGVAIGSGSVEVGKMYLWGSGYPNRIILGIEESSVNDLKTWLSTHNTDVYYQLETQTLIDLNQTVDLTLYEGTNTITNSEDMDMSLTYHY